MTADFETRSRTAQLVWLLEQALSEARQLSVKAPGRCGPEVVSRLKWLRDEMENYRLIDAKEEHSASNS